MCDTRAMMTSTGEVDLRLCEPANREKTLLERSGNLRWRFQPQPLMSTVYGQCVCVGLPFLGDKVRNHLPHHFLCNMMTEAVFHFTWAADEGARIKGNPPVTRFESPVLPRGNARFLLKNIFLKAAA